MNNISKLDLYQNFIEKEQLRTKVRINGETEAILDYCQYIIHSQYDKKSKTRYAFKQRKNQISEDFMRAYETLDKQDKIRYYIKNVSYLLRIHNRNMKTPQVRTDTLQASVYSKTHSLGRWKQRRMRLDNSRQVIFSQRKDKIQQFDLGDYIFRGSKNTKFFTFVLQAIKSTVHKKLKTAHFGFDSAEQMQTWADAVQLCIYFRHWQRIYIQIYHKLPPRQYLPTQKLEKDFISQQRSSLGNTLKSPRFQNLPTNSPLNSPTNYPLLKAKQMQQIKIKKQSQSQEQFSSDSISQTKSPRTPIKRANLEKSIIEQLVEGESNNNIQTIESKNQKQVQNQNIRHFNFFHKMFPDFEFNEVEWEGNYEMIYNEPNMRIMQNMDEKQKYKMVMEFQSQKETPCEYIFKAICGPNFQKQYNDNIEETSIKTLISSQNAGIMYMQLKAFSRIYRPRDFVFIRHGFSIGPNAYYIADKDIQNGNFPPFITIVRGKYECIWAILRKSMNKIVLIGTISMDNFGYLNDNQNSNLVLNYLKNYSRLPQFIRNNKDRLKNYVLFDINWDITKNKDNQRQNQLRIKRKTQRIKLKQKQQQMINVQESPKFISTKTDSPPFNLAKNMGTETTTLRNQNIQILNKSKQVSRESLTKNLRMGQGKQNLDISFQRQSKQKQIQEQRRKMSMQNGQGEIDPRQIQPQKFETNQAIKLRFDQKGMVVIERGFIKGKYQLVPTKTYPSLVWTAPGPGQHPLWSNDWKHDTKNGGMLFINQKKIDDQKGVLKFVLSKIGKNIMSGKSILNISLPCDIFTAKSNLELLIQSLCYATLLLQKAVNKSEMQKFKATVAFGVSMSSLYLIMEKPFNPILGQTFQAWIHGCPAYGEQISHHPPISALLVYGRGYVISGQLQSKAELSMNSGKGTNDGIFRINFNDGSRICYCSAGGEVTGVMYGERKFNVQGKAYCWSEAEHLFTQIVYNPSKKGFFSMKKQQQPEDYFEGQAYRVSANFISSLQKNRRAPAQNQIKDTLGKFTGVWHQQISYENENILNIIQQLPHKLQYEKNPLPSDSNWREDIAYRRLMQIPKAQNEKQRLEVVQRNDRKLREKRK